MTNNNNKFAENFENILKKQSLQITRNIYADQYNNSRPLHLLNSSCSARDVVSSVASNIKAYQRSDCVKLNKNVRKNLDGHKKSGLLPVNILAITENAKQKTTTSKAYDTQCVTDTQLLDLVQKVEECTQIDRDITREFDTTFERNENQDSKMINPSHIEKDELDNLSHYSDDMILCSNVVSNFNDECNIKENDNVEIEVVDDIPSSPVFKSSSKISFSPYLVYDLKQFESFEKVAAPIVNSQDNLDTEDIKLRINEEDRKCQIANRSSSPILQSVRMKGIEKKEDSPVIDIIPGLSLKLTEEMIKDVESLTESVLKDEILFSSDEENDFLMNNIVEDNLVKAEEELPLTCALETSFYTNKSDILDKTMYVCFQTASNKPIQVSTENYEEAENILEKDSITLQPLTVTELVAMCKEEASTGTIESKPIESINNKNAKTIHNDTIMHADLDESNMNEIDLEEIERIESTIKEKETSNLENKDHNTILSMGFMTANKNKITLSEEALVRHKKVFQGIDLNETFDDTDLTEYKDGTDTESSVEKLNAISFSTCSDNNIKMTTDDLQNNSKVTEIVEVQNNKRLKIDNTSDQLNASPRNSPILQDFIGFSDNEIKSSRNLATQSKMYLNKDEEEMNRKINDEVSRRNEYVGFQTASKKEITISKEAFVKTKQLFGDEEFNDIVDIKFKNAKNSKTVDLTSASQSKTSKSSSDDVFKDKLLTPYDTKQVYPGFKTASNKQIMVSTEALAKHKTVFQDIIDTEMNEKSSVSNNQTDEHVSGFMTAKEEDNNIGETDMENIFFSKNDKLKNVVPETRIFEGFKTASNKTIEVSKEALYKTKGFFEEIIKTVNDKTTNTKSEAYVSITSEQKIEVSNMDLKTKTKDKNIENTSFTGFKTANNKPIKISEHALAKSKVVFDSIDKDLDEKMVNATNIFDTFKPLSNKNSTPKQSMNKSKPIPHEERVQNINTIGPNCGFSGFKTASNKTIKVSENALLKSKKILESIDKEVPEASCTKNTVVHESELAIDKMDSDCNNTKKHFKLGGFKTASNKQINISEKALAKTKMLFENLVDLSKDAPNSFSGFKTANNKVITVSEDAIARSKEMLELSENDIPNTSTITTGFSGFKTANNKVITVSEDAIAKSKDILELTEKNILNTTTKVPSFSGFKTANNKVITVSEDAIAKSKVMLELSDNDIPRTSKEVLGFSGFKTANNKVITVSEDAIAKSKDILELSEKDILNTTTKVPSFSGFKTANNKVITVSEDAIAKSKDILELSEKDIVNTTTKVPSFSGFKTANNKVITVSEDAIAKSKVMLELSDNDIPSTSKEVLGFSGFKTANNKVITVSEDAIAKSKVMLELSENDIPNTSTKTAGFSGFKTANNKVIPVSEDAIAKSKVLLELLDSDITNIPTTSKKALGFSGFKTANNKDITVSEEAIAKSKEVLELSENATSTKEPGFSGFKTASNKGIKISEESLAKTKMIFESIDTDITDKNIDAQMKFGFQTANKKPIYVSEEALLKSKNLLQDVDKEIIEKEIDKSKITFGGFQTGRNESVQVSNDSLQNAKRAFQETDTKEFHTYVKKNKDEDSIKVNIENTQHSKMILQELQLDTQVLDNFEHAMNTEDFCADATPKAVKRPASPILSCPKAKRRNTFKTPYKITKPINSEIKINTNNTENIEIVNKSFLFEKEYKKNKILDLKILDTLERGELNEHKTDPYLYNFTLDNLLNFEFLGIRNDFDKTAFTIKDLKKLFLNSVKKKIVPEGWVDNHLKLILWKLLSYEIKYPNVLKNVCSVKNVLNQLKYRYDKELYNVQRPALRKVLEKDEISTRTMVLCVARIFQDGVSVASVKDLTKTTELELTDGWYFIMASIDKMLTKLVYDERIVVGSKIVTHGAEILNCEQGKSPWEDTSNVRLKIFGNSTRLARWDAKLGFHGNGAAAILSRLTAVKVDGGKVSRMRVLVTRVYPTLYVEKFEDGSTVTRSERLEEIHQSKYENERQALLERLYEEIEKDASSQYSQDSSDTETSGKRKCMESGSQIAKMMKRSKDPVEFKSKLTDTQVAYLNDYTTKHNERRLLDIQEKFRIKLESQGLSAARNVVNLLKVRVVDLDSANGLNLCRGMISIWRPSDAITEIVDEGSCIEVMNIVPTAIRYSEIQLSAGRQTLFKKINRTDKNEKLQLHAKTFLRNCSTISEIVKNPTTKTEYDEVDLIGIVVEIEPDKQEFEKNTRKYNFQNVFLADVEKNIVCINFWGGIKKFGFENVLDTGQTVYCRNLQKRVGNTRKLIPQFRVTELSFITKTPKNTAVRNSVLDITKKFNAIDKKQFYIDCSVAKNMASNKYGSNENVSPYRSNLTDNYLSRNRLYIESPLASNVKCQVTKKEDFNLTGLDFESTFKQRDTQDLSPEMLLRKKKVNDKIAKLKMYGEPPPLSPIQIQNKCKNAGKEYKSPFSSNTSLENKNLPNKQYSIKSCTSTYILGDSSSPVMPLNRTFVKNSINPVKLNFSGVETNENAVEDHFAEDFESSPPLSLD